MGPKRIQYGRCSFLPPEGFVILQEASSIPSHSSGCVHGTNCAKMPICITLTSTAIHPGVPDISESPEDLYPDAYPASITLSTNKSMIHGRPLEYLRKTEEVLQRYHKDFEIDFCEKEMVGEYTAARSQSFFVTNFRLYRLNFAWLADNELVTTTIMVTEPGVEKGWVDLRNFVKSVSL